MLTKMKYYLGDITPSSQFGTLDLTFTTLGYLIVRVKKGE